MAEAHAPAPTIAAQPALDAKLARLQAGKQAWAQLPVAARIAVLDQIVADLPAIEERWVAASLAAKSGQMSSLAEGEERFTLTVTYRLLRYLRKALVDIEKHGQPRLPGKVCWKHAGEWRLDVYPQSVKDFLALPFVKAEVRVYDSMQGDEPPRAAFYRQADPQAKICLVLAAGNIASTVNYDFLHKLFVEGQAVFLKMNPVNAYLAPLIEEGFRALIEPGYMQVAEGGAEVASYLVNHPAIDELHLTGSDRTYEAIVFGPGEDGRRRKRDKQPLVTKPFSAELGNISPVIVVPGPWSAADVRKQAAKIGGWLVRNAGFNCITPRMLIQHAAWAQRQPLNEAIAAYLAELPTRKAYYPGAERQHAEFVQAYPQAQQLGQPAEGQLPWTFVAGLDPADAGQLAFCEEPFMGLFSETALDAADTIEFIANAVKFANEQLWGSLSVSIIVHPKSLQDPLVAAAVEQAVDDLNYGTVVVNHWGALGYYMGITPWGAAPGHDMYDIQSGVGFINNPLMFDRPLKSVVRAPFVSIPDPYHAHSRRSYLYFRQDTRYQAKPSVWNLLKSLWYALIS
ncbi:MAG: aldehyde dehydrogenase family protein [Anaerolineales bacterium]|nr:aldehyde dehydrogenase family protein [Anaerolineales bacterium]